MGRLFKMDLEGPLYKCKHCQVEFFVYDDHPLKTRPFIEYPTNLEKLFFFMKWFCLTSMGSLGSGASPSAGPADLYLSFVQLFVLPPASGDAAFLASPHCDPKVKQLEGLIASTFNFDKSIWPGGDSSLPSLRSSRKRKCNHCQSDSSSSTEEPDAKKVMRDLRSRSKSKAKRSQTLSQKNVKSLKASLIVEVRELIDKTLHDNTVLSATVNVTSPVNPASSLPRRVTRSASTAMSVESVANCSTARKKSSVASAKLSASAHTLTESAHNALPSPIRNPSLSTASSQGCTGFRNCPTGAPPNVPASPAVSGSHAPAVIPSPATYPVSSLCPDNIVFTEKALRCPSLLHEAKKLTLESSCIPSASDQGPASNHAPEVSNPHCPHPSPYLSTTPGVAAKHKKNLLPNQLSTSSTQLKDVCALNSTAGPSPLSSPVKHLLQSTSRKTMTRSQARIASLASAKCSQQLLVSGPAMNLRTKKQAPKPPVGDSSEYILSTLEAINSPTVSKFLVKLSKLQGSEYTINGQRYPAAFFSEISKPQKWVSSLHIDCIVSFLWKKHGAYLASRRITLLDSMFTSIMSNKFMSFSQNLNTSAYAWNPLLIAYARDCTPQRKVVSYMSPIAQMLPSLLQSLSNDVPATWPSTGFTFMRVPHLAQNDRGGDCGPMSLKFIELHSHQLTSSLQHLTKKQVDSIRMHYAMDLYAEYLSLS
ncbi:predicted protein [Arabidopsis lyrata subsp. lyrata]|uniref:Predicted protein n=1 Tax=Arabidopsis lyrata subsp. lyrata TaxID=81972 RepID=D7L029_ARALL|nr:predicted protein [Arabidopsis lyrata subsp. lyrata]